MILLIRIVLAAAGALCIYVALLVYEDEEQRAQSYLETLWIKLDDAGDSAVSAHRTFLAKVAQVTSLILDRLFGLSVFGKQAVVVSYWYSFASLGLFGLISTPDQEEPMWTTSLVMFLAPGILGTIPAVSRRLRFLSLLLALITVGFAMLFFLILTAEKYWGYRVLTLSLLMGVGTDMVFIALTRRFLRWLAGRTRLVFALMALGLSVPIGILLWAVPIRIGGGLINLGLAKGDATYEFVAAWAISMATNLPVFLVGALYLSLLVTFGLHRVFWPLQNRFIYALQRYGIVEKKARLWRFGLACSVLAVAPLEKLLGKLGPLLGLK